MAFFFSCYNRTTISFNMATTVCLKPWQTSACSKSRLRIHGCFKLQDRLHIVKFSIHMWHYLQKCSPVMVFLFQTCFSIKTSYFQYAVNYARAYRLTMAVLFAIESHTYDVAFSYNVIYTMIRNLIRFVLQAVSPRRVASGWPLLTAFPSLDHRLSMELKNNLRRPLLWPNPATTVSPCCW